MTESKGPIRKKKKRKRKLRQCGTAEKKKQGAKSDWWKGKERQGPQCESAKVVTGFTSPVPPSSDQNGLTALSVLQEKEVHSLVYFFFGRHLNISRIYAKILQLQF